jgi:error-prone DNA polymerase
MKRVVPIRSPSAYAELQVTSNFSFLEGASHAEELVRTAAALEHSAIAVTDRNSLAGIVRAHRAAKIAGMRLVVGCRLDFLDRPSLLCFPTDRSAYGRLSSLLTLGKRRAPKAECHLRHADLTNYAEGQILVMVPPEAPSENFAEQVRHDASSFGRNYYLAAQHRYRGDDAERIAWLDGIARVAGTRLVATNDVLYHVPERRALQDVLACIRLKCRIETAGPRLEAHAERHLKPAAEMARLFRRHPDAIAAGIEIAERCRFSLAELKYDYPDEVPPGSTPQQELERRIRSALAARYGSDVPPRVAGQITHELALIGELGYAAYFLTVHDIVLYARSQGILCQGRGSAANSAICYVLGITAIDPVHGELLFERFVSKARNEPPDIDVDFAHERREEVIQHIYAKYGRDRAGLAATVISYRMRSAVREVGKVMGLSADTVAAMSKSIWGWSTAELRREQLTEIGLDPDEPRLARTLKLAHELVGFPRHLSQHVGGFVITRGPLAEMVPILNAAMPDRTNIEWDKDDLDAVGMLKIDVLGLGMLTCIDKAFALARQHHGAALTLASVPQDVPDVYAMLQRADAVGVFQIESRAQMSMLPRLKPKCFYDLVIEVAIVRPGPIQGDMVHPYLRRREGREQVDYAKPELEAVLKKTLGVPLFQEQAMRIAIVAAGFTPSEADELRRAMATFKRNGMISSFRAKFIDGMVGNGYAPDFAERCFKQIEGFSTYGFPESHAASFALLVYISAWLKWRYPDVFACALLNSQPMGFYAPAQIVRDAKEHGVAVRPVDVNHSEWDCTLEKAAGETRALRLGFRQIKGFPETAAAALVAARQCAYTRPDALARRAGLGVGALETLARADAFRSMGLDRRAALWAVKGLDVGGLPLFAGLDGRLAEEPAVALPAMPIGEHVAEDYGSTGLSLKRHPLALLRDRLAGQGVQPCRALQAVRAGRRIKISGLAITRQRPGTASGVVFVTLEDETGIANIIVWSSVFERFRRVVMTGRLIAVRGLVQKEGIVIHVVAEELTDLSAELDRLDAPLPLVHGRGDEVTHPGEDQRPVRVKSRDFH